MYEKNAAVGTESPELLEKLISLQKKELRHARFATIASVILIAVVLIVFTILIPQVMSLITHAEDSLTGIDTLAAEADSVLKDLNGMLSETEVLVQNANRIIVDNTEDVTEAVEKINAVDFVRLNEAINGLADAVEPLARFANIFK